MYTVQEHLMRPRFDLIQNGFIKPENEAFALDIARYKDLNKARDLINGHVANDCSYPFNSLIFHPRNKVFILHFKTMKILIKYDACIV